MPNSEAYRSVAFGSLSIFSMGGVIFGIASLYEVLYSDNVLVSSCLASEQEECAMRTGEEAGYKCCEAQKLQYTLLSSVALFAADGVMILYGEYSDRAGPRACFTVGTALAWSGLGTIALNSLWGLDWLWYVAFFLVGISGPGVFMGVLFLAEKHPELRAIVTSLTASMWDSSSIVFLIFHAAYFNLGISLHSVTLFWLALCVLSGVHSWFTLPSLEGVSRIRAAHAASEGDGDGGIELTRGESEFEPTAELIEAPAGGLLSQLIRADTLLMYAFMAVYNLKSTFFITTFADQMLQLFPPETHGKTAESLALTFDTAFPVGGLLTSAVASVLLEKLGDREDLYMALVLTITIVFGIANLLPFVFTQYVAALLFGPARTIQWACYFHFLGLPSRYSPQFVGRLLGYGNLVIAAVGDVPPYGLNHFVEFSTAFGSVGARYIAVHFALQIMLLGCLALPVHLHHSWQRDDERKEAARQTAATVSAEDSRVPQGSAAAADADADLEPFI